MKLKKLALILIGLGILGFVFTSVAPSYYGSMTETAILVAKKASKKKTRRLQIRRENESRERRSKRQRSRFAANSMSSVGANQILLLAKKDRIAVR